MTREPTDDLAADLVGAWGGVTDEEDWHHPIANMAAAPESGGDMGSRIWMFRPDGTGHVWYALNVESGSYENDQEFTWNVVGDEVVVNDFPPATMEIHDAEYLLMHPIEPGVEASAGVLIRRCDLELPDGDRFATPVGRAHSFAQPAVPRPHRTALQRFAVSRYVPSDQFPALPSSILNRRGE